MAQGDGWVRGYEAVTGKKLWEFDTNPKDSVWPKTRNEVIATPVVYDGLVYIANGQDPEHGEGVGPLVRDRRHQARRHHRDRPRLALRQDPALDLDRRHPRRLVYYPDFSGFLHCLDAKTGQAYWVHDMFAAVWGSALVADGKVYLGDEDGDVVVLQAGKEKKVLAEMNMGSSVYSTPVPANGALFITNRNQLFALAEAGVKPATDCTARSTSLQDAGRVRRRRAGAPRRARGRAAASGVRCWSPTRAWRRPATPERAAGLLRDAGVGGLPVPRTSARTPTRAGGERRPGGARGTRSTRWSAWAAAARSTARRGSASWSRTAARWEITPATRRRGTRCCR